MQNCYESSLKGEFANIRLQESAMNKFNQDEYYEQ
jgi:hypothetical protein